MKRSIVITLLPLIIAACNSGNSARIDQTNKLDLTLANYGEKIFVVKCVTCHKLTEEKLIGPGLHGVSERHSAEWLMNFISKPDQMLDTDTEAQALLKIWVVRMPNQNLTSNEARQLLEFLRKNDGVN